MAASKKARKTRFALISKELAAVADGRKRRAEAALSLGVSAKTLDRLRKNPPLGPNDLIHANAGRRAAHALDPELKTRVAKALSGPDFRDYGPTLAQEHLFDCLGVKLCKESVRSIMSEAGLWKKKKSKRARGRPSRPPRPRFGELVQADGCLHAWLDGQPNFCLMLMVDDATSQIVGARFEPNECAIGYARALDQMILSHGIPMAIYSDRHSVFTTTPEAGGPPGPNATRFAAALERLGIESILAGSAPAKGRVERMNQTLQGRLPQALRQAKIKTIEEANAFLPGFVDKLNAKFGKAPELPESAFVGWTDTREALAQALCLRQPKKLSKNRSFVSEGALYQLLPEAEAAAKKRSLAGESVDLCFMHDGSVAILWRGIRLPFMTLDAKRQPVAGSRKEIDPAVECVIERQKQQACFAAKAAKQAASRKRLSRMRELESKGLAKPEINAIIRSEFYRQGMDIFL